METPLPVPLALVLCDLVWNDLGTKKNTLLGTFDVIFSKSFPATHRNIGVYAVLADGRGELEFSVRIVDVDEKLPRVAEQKRKIIFSDPMQNCDLVLNFADVTFPQPGDYRVQVFVSEQFLIERKLQVVLFEEKA